MHVEDRTPEHLDELHEKHEKTTMEVIDVIAEEYVKRIKDCDLDNADEWWNILISVTVACMATGLALRDSLGTVRNALSADILAATKAPKVKFIVFKKIAEAQLLPESVKDLYDERESKLKEKYGVE